MINNTCLPVSCAETSYGQILRVPLPLESFFLNIPLLLSSGNFYGREGRSRHEAFLIVLSPTATKRVQLLKILSSLGKILALEDQESFPRVM